MCELNLVSLKKSVTGYKVVVVTPKGYFSPCTGIKYVVGKVKTPNLRKKIVVAKHFFAPLRHIINTGGCAYQPNMVGRTCVFRYKSDADSWRDSMASQDTELKIAVLKMRISGDLMTGFYSLSPVVGGKNIDRIYY